jgi:hypothetical protein
MDKDKSVAALYACGWQFTTTEPDDRDHKTVIRSVNKLLERE